MARPRQIPDAARNWLRACVDADGVHPVARRLHMSDATVARAVGGLPVQEGTVALIEVAHQAHGAVT
jgi:hypothetical protein